MIDGVGRHVPGGRGQLTLPAISPFPASGSLGFLAAPSSDLALRSTQVLELAGHTYPPPPPGRSPRGVELCIQIPAHVEARVSGHALDTSYEAGSSGRGRSCHGSRGSRRRPGSRGRGPPSGVPTACGSIIRSRRASRGPFLDRERGGFGLVVMAALV